MESDDSPLTRMVMYAKDGELLRALAARGAKTRPVAKGQVKVSLRLDPLPPAPRQRRRTRRASIVNALSTDPRVRT